MKIIIEKHFDGYEVSVKDEDLENLDESKIDAMLDHFKKEGIN